MIKIDVSKFANLPKEDQACLLNAFLFNLTIGVREIIENKNKDIIRKLRGINQIYHMVIPFVDSIMFGHKTSYTIDIIASNLEDMSHSYNIEHQIVTAWKFAQKSNSIPKEN